jgi:hypothetical protein
LGVQLLAGRSRNPFTPDHDMAVRAISSLATRDGGSHRARRRRQIRRLMSACVGAACEAVSPVARTAWWLLLLRALWLLPDWLAKWKTVMQTDRADEGDVRARLCRRSRRHRRLDR